VRIVSALAENALEESDGGFTEQRDTNIGFLENRKVNKLTHNY